MHALRDELFARMGFLVMVSAVIVTAANALHPGLVP